MLRHLLSKQLRSTFYISGAFVIYLKAGKGQRAPPEHGELQVPWQPGKPRMASPPPSRLPAAGPHLTDAPSTPRPWSPAGQPTAHLPISESVYLDLCPQPGSRDWALITSYPMQHPGHLCFHSPDSPDLSLQSCLEQTESRVVPGGSLGLRSARLHKGACERLTALPSPPVSTLHPSPLSTPSIFRSVPSPFRTEDDVVFLFC